MIPSFLGSHTEMASSSEEISLQHPKLPFLPKVWRNKMLLSWYLFLRSRLHFFFLTYQGDLSLRIFYWVPDRNLTQVSVRSSCNYKQHNTQLPVNWMKNASNSVKAASEGQVWGTLMLPRPLTLVCFCPAVLSLLNCSVLRPFASWSQGQSVDMVGRKKMGSPASSVLPIKKAKALLPVPQVHFLLGFTAQNRHHAVRAPCEGGEAGVWSNIPNLNEHQNAWRGLLAHRLVGDSPRTVIPGAAAGWELHG